MLAVVLFLAGLALLVIGGKLAEQGAVSLAQSLGLSETLVGLTIVAIATSLPELATGVMAIRRGHADLAVGNVIGSNIFNLLLVLGLTSTITPIPVPDWGMWDLGLMVLVTAALFTIVWTHRHAITRTEGAFLLVGYVAYMVFVVVRELSSR